MSITKVTLLFNLGTTDSDGNAARTAGWSESYYNILALDATQLNTQWIALQNARALLLPAGARIVGSRYQTVDPVGGTRSFDQVVVSSSSAACDLPSIALQWTVRSTNSPNQRSLILRGIPDGRSFTGEYSPTSGYGQLLLNFFAQLRANWRFRGIDRTILPVKIKDITGGVMTTVKPHGLIVGDDVNVMSTKLGGDPPKKTSYKATVVAVTALTATLALPGRNDFIADSDGGRARKALIIYPQFSILDAEVLTPTLITRKAGAPFRKFRGRRTAKR